MKIEEAKRIISNIIYTKDGNRMNYIDIDNFILDDECCESFIRVIETVLAELEKKDKIIDKMASELYYKCYDDLRSIKDIKDYFEKEVIRDEC